MTVDELIVLLRQCERSAPVTFEHDGHDHHVEAVETRRYDGVVELLSGYRRENWEAIFRDIGRDVRFPVAAPDEAPMVHYWCGRNIEELSREELLEALKSCAVMLDRTRERASEINAVWADLHRASIKRKSE